MAGFPRITFEDAQLIRSASKKLKFSPAKLLGLEKAKKRGASDQQAFANLLGVPTDTDIREYLRSELTEPEYDTFVRILGDKFPKPEN